MKKLFPITIVAVVAMMFTSCKKDYTCTCTVTVGGVSTSGSTTFPKTTKSKAKDACSALQSTGTAGTGGMATYTCSIK